MTAGAAGAEASRRDREQEEHSRAVAFPEGADDAVRAVARLVCELGMVAPRRARGCSKSVGQLKAVTLFSSVARGSNGLAGDANVPRRAEASVRAPCIE